jgi:Ca2+-binding EF-hand superfamily protein
MHGSIAEFISLFRYINAIRQAFDFYDPRQTGSIDLPQVVPLASIPRLPRTVLSASD